MDTFYYINPLYMKETIKTGNQNLQQLPLSPGSDLAAGALRPAMYREPKHVHHVHKR